MKGFNQYQTINIQYLCNTSDTLNFLCLSKEFLLFLKLFLGKGVLKEERRMNSSFRNEDRAKK